MAIDYIQVKDGATVSSAKAAEKIKVFLLDRLLHLNPFLIHRYQSDDSEGFNAGGGVYHFKTPLGVPAAIRRTKAPTNGQVKYGNTVTIVDKTLTIQEPLVFPGDNDVIAVENSDKVQMDNIDYSQIAVSQVVNSLVEGQIKIDADAMLNAPKARKIDLSTETDAFNFLRKLKQAIADYYQITAANANWPNDATSGDNVSRFFTGNVGRYLESQIKIHMLPSAKMELTNYMTGMGAGSDMQFKQMEDGKVTIFGGIEIISNQYLGDEQMMIAPLNIVGVPDLAVMKTLINVFYQPQTDINCIKGFEWYDAILLVDELVTLIDTGDLTAKVIALNTKVVS